MHETGKKLLNLMFRSGETICVSHNKFGYHSIPLDEVLEKEYVTLVPTQESCEKRKIKFEDSFEKMNTSNLLLAAINPIKGWREDVNCTAYRNFLIEVDYGALAQQLEYIKALKLPYSACVFSGNKSLHFIISLDQDIPSEAVWRHLAEWTLKIATMADQQTKNPSRSIRIPGALREPGKKQMLVEYRGPTSMADFTAWLKLHPDAKPQISEKKPISGDMDFSKVKGWVSKRLRDGLDPTKGRNAQWFAIACEFALAGYEEDDTIEKLLHFFVPDHDFKEREWKITIKSAFKHIYANRKKE